MSGLRAVCDQFKGTKLRNCAGVCRDRAPKCRAVIESLGRRPTRYTGPSLVISQALVPNLERAMIPSDSDRPAPPPPEPNGLGGAEDPEATGSYIHIPVAGPPPGTAISGLSPSRERFDFLAPPRAEGELGWLGYYRVLRLLGKGNMGLVFRAEDSLLSRPVALKVIRPEIAHSPVTTQRFMREARATAAIKHDHIVTIYQVGEENGVPFLAMEYLTGMSLAQWLERGRSPSVELVLRLGREIADGLSAAHRHGLIHRDIKPANIWLEAPSGRVKILDFGMARSQRDDVEITLSGTVMGTPAIHGAGAGPR